MKRIIAIGLLAYCTVVSWNAEASVSQSVSNVDDCHPAGIISTSARHCIIVEKKSQKLFVYNLNDNHVKDVMQYRCTTGENQGDKRESGDRKTPEGVYFFTRVYSDDQLPQRYGSMAFVLDFPNHLDRLEGKGGNGIWLHGLNRPLVRYDTKGCVALRNEDITEIGSYIQLLKTPIIIENSIRCSSPSAAQRTGEKIKHFLVRWEDAWEGKKLLQYVNCYSRSRYTPSQWRRWRNKKQRLNRTYKFIDVRLYDINIFKHDGTFVVKFIQDYESDVFSSIGCKTLFIEDGSDGLSIIREDWIDRTPDGSWKEGADETPERKLCRLLNTWVHAWEHKQLDRYMSCYSPGFHAEGMSREQWRRHKAGINEHNEFISVSVEKPEIHIRGTAAAVKYLQKYISDTYTDYGIKRLELEKRSGEWRISSETWEPL